ncbi:uncharacterized protein LOC143038398 isoform X3 [Oratosquilla oratoria]|uniref:uncharacterized protein LOC143038398 isoform X3 n=1 Tax=Oratosquilla oratoria TaxID=337810 RepID=UPI003F76A1AF
MAGDERWYFTKEDINNSPSRRCGIDAEKELSYRQQGANLIQDMGQRLQVNQLAINTAIVYLHRFYMFHSFPRFHRNSMAPAALFLAAKVEEQPRKLEHVIKVAHHCLCRDQPPLDVSSEAYLEKAQELVVNENILLQTLGFDVAIDHPHTHVVKCCQLVRAATRDLAQTSYFMATNSLHLTTMCLQYRPTVVACFCIYIVCKWINYEIQKSSEGKEWFWYVDKTVTVELLEQLTAEFLAVMDKCPARLKKMISASNHASSDERSRNQTISSANSSSSRSNTAFPSNLPSSSRGHESSSHHKPPSKSQSSQQQQQQQQAPARQHRLNISEYNEKREKERRERERADRERERADRDRERADRYQALAHQVTGIGAHGTLHNRATDIGGSGRLKHPTETATSKHHSHGNHKAHPHSSTSSSTVASRDVARGTDRRDARRDPSIRVDERTSDTVVDGSAYEKSKHSVTESRHLVDSKPARTQSEAVDRKLDIKQEQRQPTIKVESSKVKTEVKQEPRQVEVKMEPIKVKEEVKMPETIFNNSDINNYDFLRDSSLLEGPPAELFDSSDSESKPDITSLLDSPVRTSSKSKSPVSKPLQVGKNLSGVVPTEVDQQQPQATAAASLPAVQTQQVQQPSQERHYGTSNGSVPHQTTTQPPEKAPETSKTNQSAPKSSTSRSVKEPRTPTKVSSQVSGSSSRKRTVSEKSDPELVPVLTKLEATKYGQALKDGSKVKIKGDGDSGEVHGKGSVSHVVETSSKVTEPVLKVKLPIKIDPSRDSYSVDSHPSVPDGVSDVPESKKHKHENSHHKHKKEKKHKHKEKDKHKDKDYKEHKKEKKHKKHKDKDKERNDTSVSDNCGLKITINRKMLMPPEVPSSPKPEGGSGVKIKIKKPKTKKRDLFGASSSTSPESSPARDATPNQPNQPLKLKISKLHIKPEKESRKRERDRSPGDSHTAKMPRNGSPKGLG